MLTYVLLLIGFACLIKGADWFVEGSSSVARLLNVPPVIIGLTIVAFGTSAPEAAVSITAALADRNELALGNVIGSNLFNLLVVVGVCALIKPMKISAPILKKEFPISIIFGLLLLVLCMDTFFFGAAFNTINFVDGWILLAAFAAFLIWQIGGAIKAMRSKTLSAELEAVDVRVLSPFKSILFIVIGLILVVAGGDLVVDKASVIAASFGLSETFIGLTIVAMGTSLPELVTSIVASRKGENDLALGNVVGSNIFNFVFIIGISTVISPIAVGIHSIYDLFVLAIVSIIVLIFAKAKKSISRFEGFLMVCMYIGYLAYIIMR